MRKLLLLLLLVAALFSCRRYTVYVENPHQGGTDTLVVHRVIQEKQ